MNEQYAVKISALHKKLGPTQALADLSTNFQANTMHGLIGPEGAGKTTLMRCLTGLLKPDLGKISFINAGAEINFVDVRPHIAYMPQQQCLYADLSIAEHLEFFRAMFQVPTAEYKVRRQELLELTRLHDFVNRPAGQLSGGMYKKLGLMCALLRSPKILLLDEPTNGVDPISRREFWEFLYALREHQILIIVATAYMDEAERCDAVHLMQDGRLVAHGEPKELLAARNLSSIDQLFLNETGRDHEHR